MVNVIYKKKGLKINAIWFSDGKSGDINENKVDFIFFHGVRDNAYKNAIVNLQYTLITDLEEDLDCIFKKINKNFRYHINRAKKEDTNCVVFNSDDLMNEPDLLNNFKKQYAIFTKLKGIDNTYNQAAMEKYMENGNVILTKAFKGNEDYAQHIIICDGINARLLYSVSNFRTEGADRNFIGRANKYLHWNDIEYLKNRGFQQLDWGGISSIVSLNGVDKFKKHFGGMERQHYNIIEGKSFLGKAAVMAKKMVGGN
ncbi:hypothetical protein HBE96_13600 [Clostridium sp. P21]|uniref:Uncharacterized protein n=1 Tax=Clostridium muellerianum TaxID=2716538 RepID=A0A7Y0HN70_9CLOT|nr:hypothetical protein [Clostridium muellerianum]NMM63689.1 hypothetical protein [Clostridium muellerianum]